MPNVERLLLSCSKGRSSGHTTRKLIGFKSQSQYTQCLKELAKYGIRPVKSIRRNRVICCHVDSRRTQQLQSLAEHPNVSYVEPDFKLHAHGFETKPRLKNSKVRISAKASLSTRTRTNSRTHAARKAKLHSDTSSSNLGWNLSQIEANKVWSSTKGKGAGIAIIDTGIAKHSDLRIYGGVNTMGGSSYKDDNGHGTHVAGIAAAIGANGIIQGVAPRARLYAVKALDASGAGYVSDIIKGIDWCISKKIPIINMSLGLEGETSSALKEAVQRARQNGIIVVASAGNSGTSTGRIDQPARYSSALAVAASTRNGKVANYSSRGYGIDVTAPGSYIKSTSLGGGYQVLSGTSMSSPHVAGGVALLKSLDPSIGPSTITKRLRASAKRISNYSYKAQGYGIMQLAGAAASSSTDQSTEAAARKSKSGHKSRRKRS
ncbi:S8 family peptidase [Paenibacillus sp. CF384]|uniref:S8 family peptidase n=1 Tax=Paenibacillus sp. CF384 TaxID=1884382 RepID=UPI00089ABDE6|nr:S8 family peptidase [Paenibacillus sp. CF384]SDW32471.1 minor extracellular protease Epr [Paenibacillus sp. CF384]